MIILMVVSAVFVALALDRQQRRHRLQLEIECIRYGVDMPVQRPRVSRFEGYLNAAMGVLLFLAGCAMGWVLLAGDTGAAPPGALQAPALFVAAGLVIAVAGGRILLRSRR